MSSPARSSVSATSAGQGGGGSSNAGFGDEASPFHIPDLISPQERKEEALAVLKLELAAALQKEVKSLDEDSWKFAGPRSQIHLITRPGGYLQKRTGKYGEANHFRQQTGNAENAER